MGWLSRKGKRRAEGLSDAVLFDSFQSMGDDCEFGLVQTHFGATQIGLCKSAYTPADSLMLMLETRFVDMLKTGLAIRLDNQVHIGDRIEYAAIVDLYGTRYHTQVWVPADEGTVVAKERKRLALLARTFIEDLEDGEKIFVIKAHSRTQVEAICDRIRNYGSATLLWVTPAQPGSPAGHVEWLSEGLMLGRIDHLARSMLPFDADLCGWREVCRSALTLRDSS